MTMTTDIDLACKRRLSRITGIVSGVVLLAVIFYVITLTRL